MIRLRKGDKPDVLEQYADRWNSEYVVFVTTGIGVRASITRHRHPEIKIAVRRECHDKCMYCESFISATQPGDVEHIAPKSKYPHLYVDWDNLGFACRVCNTAKSDHEGVINPYVDDPAIYIRLHGPIIAFHPADMKARTTVDGLTLNRADLVLRRASALKGILDKLTLREMLPESGRFILDRELAESMSDSSEFSAVVRAFVVEIQAKPLDAEL